MHHTFVHIGFSLSLSASPLRSWILRPWLRSALRCNRLLLHIGLSRASLLYLKELFFLLHYPAPLFFAAAAFCRIVHITNSHYHPRYYEHAILVSRITNKGVCVCVFVCVFVFISSDFFLLLNQMKDIESKLVIKCSSYN